MSQVDEAAVSTETPTQVTEPGAGDAGAGDAGASGGADHHRRTGGFWTRRRLLGLITLILAGLVLVGGVFVWYLMTHKPITALPGLTQDAVPHFSYSLYGVDAPLGVAVSADGSRIYVTEGGGKFHVKMLSTDGHLLATLPLPGNGMHIPVYVAINPQTNNVYVTDRATGAIYEFTADGSYLRQFSPTGFAGELLPLGLAFDAQGDLFVTRALAKTNQVLEFDSGGALKRTLTTPVDMSFPNGIAIDSHGDVAVTDSNNGRAFVFDANAKLSGTVSSGLAPADLGLPRGATFDSEGHLLIVDTTDHSVRVYKLANGSVNFIGAFGDQGVTDGRFQFPNGAASDSRARDYITDRVNNRVQVWSY